VEVYLKMDRPDKAEQQAKVSLGRGGLCVRRGRVSIGRVVCLLVLCCCCCLPQGLPPLLSLLTHRTCL
jgi:hypothetical protein